MSVTLKTALTALLVCFVLSPPASASVSQKRVLVVTTEAWDPVHMCMENNGEYVITDLATAGLPFDVVTYGKFVSMDLGNHDIIMLCGHTSPTPVTSVAAKCSAAIQQGRKVYVHTEYPHMRYDDAGNRVEYQRYALDLFSIVQAGWATLSGSVNLPSLIEQDPFITAIQQPPRSMNTYACAAPPPVVISIGNNCCGFLGANGGIVGLVSVQQKNLINYGKLASYLRYGDGCRAGFANDRIDGKPIAAFELHCDMTSYVPAIDAIDAFTRQYHVPLIALLICNRLNSATANKWNGLNNPYITFGSHSYSHPNDWTKLSDSDFLFETSYAMNLQRQMIPSTKNYFNFSGSVNPTSHQLDLIYNTGIVFGAAGAEMRSFPMPSGDTHNVEGMPTTIIWFRNLSQCSTTPFCLSHTFLMDCTCWSRQLSFCDELKTAYYQNFDYGAYTMGCLHDYMFPSNLAYYVNGVHMSNIIRSGFDFLQSQGVTCIPADELICRLRDAQAGWVDTESAGDGSFNVTAHRPGAKANQVKVLWRNGQIPVASGAAVVSHHLCKEHLYVDLQPEVESTFHVQFAEPAHFQSSVTPGLSQCTVSWTTPSDPTVSSMVVRYGTLYYPENPTDGQPFGSITAIAGNRQEITGSLDLTTFAAAHFSIFAVKSDGSYSSPPDMICLVTDRTPPDKPTITLDSLVFRTLVAHWSASDQESGISKYCYAVGTHSGNCDVVSWSQTSNKSITLTDMPTRINLYLTVKAQNGMGYWSQPSTAQFMMRDRLSDATGNPDGARVSATGVVTAIFRDFYYIEEADRTRGIRVQGNTDYLHEGDKLSISGTLTTVAGERILVQD